MSEQYYILFWNYQRKIDLKICKGQYDNIFFSKGRVVSFFGEEGSVSNTILYFNIIFSVIEGWTLLLLFSWFFRLSASLQCGSYSQINIPACCLHPELICWQHSVTLLQGHCRKDYDTFTQQVQKQLDRTEGTLQRKHLNNTGFNLLWEPE